MGTFRNKLPQLDKNVGQANWRALISRLGGTGSLLPVCLWFLSPIQEWEILRDEHWQPVARATRGRMGGKLSWDYGWRYCSSASRGLSVGLSMRSYPTAASRSPD